MILYLMYKESGDTELLIILGAMFCYDAVSVCGGISRSHPVRKDPVFRGHSVDERISVVCFRAHQEPGAHGNINHIAVVERPGIILGENAGFSGVVSVSRAGDGETGMSSRSS